MLGLTFTGVYLLTGLAYGLIAVAGLLFLDLITDLLTERASQYGRTSRPPRT